MDRPGVSFADVTTACPNHGHVTKASSPARPNKVKVALVRSLSRHSLAVSVPKTKILKRSGQRIINPLAYSVAWELGTTVIISFRGGRLLLLRGCQAHSAGSAVAATCEGPSCLSSQLSAQMNSLSLAVSWAAPPPPPARPQAAGPLSSPTSLKSCRARRPLHAACRLTAACRCRRNSCLEGDCW